MRQTGTRNIQPHLQSLLEAEGIRAVTLPDTLAPAKREAWIDAQVHNIDVLITNPKKVETGLDLIKFHTIIVYETEYSLVHALAVHAQGLAAGPAKAGQGHLSGLQRNTRKRSAQPHRREDEGSTCFCTATTQPVPSPPNPMQAARLLDELASRILAGEKLSSDGITGLLGQSMADVAEPVEEEEEEVEVIQVAGEVVQAAPTAVVIATLTPKLAIKPKATPQPTQQYSFFDLEVAPRNGCPQGATEQADESNVDQRYQRYQWSDFILSVIAKPVGKDFGEPVASQARVELKQAAAGQRSFADLLLGA